MKPSTKIILDTRRAKNNSEKYPVKLRVTMVKEQKYYPIDIVMTKEEFSLVHNPDNIKKSLDLNFRRQLKEWKLKCDGALVKANKICDDLPDFTFRLFESKLFKNKQSGTDVYKCYEENIKRKLINFKVGTASNYRSSMNSIKAFSVKLSLRDVTIEFLNEYEAWLISNGKSISTVGIYLRPLRAIISEAIEAGMISRENYPFGKRKYQIPAPRNIKKALTKEEIKMIMYYDALPDTWCQRARDFFIFSYLCNGINMKDIALLKYKNVDGDFIYFTRAKTQHTNRTSSIPISIYVTSEIGKIIDRWKNDNSDSDNYLFPILEHGITPEKEQRLIQQFTKMVNKYIKQVALNVGITKPVTTYYARHSFATIMRRGGVPTEFIGEALGHTSTKTTASYLDSFENETKKEWAKILISF
ncbi:MAG: site-specific integrase [Chitinophagaceae bacterium]